MTTSGPEPTGQRRRRSIPVLFVLIGIVALVVRLWSPGPPTQTYDESLWMHRSAAFATALGDGNLALASAEDPDLGLTNPTMPGITTIWAGVAGQGLVRLGSTLGLTDPVEISPVFSPQVLRAAQGVVAVVCTALLMLTMVLVRRLFGLRPALLSGGLLAVEPWLAALSTQLHTDALVAMFSVSALCALAFGLRGDRDRPDRSGDAVPPPRRGWIIVAAALATGALLTKANALGVLVPGGVLVGWDAWRHRYRGRLGELVRPAAAGAATAVGIALVAWPALLVSPIHQLGLVVDASGQVGRVRLRYFQGRLQGFIPHFYLMALAFRLTPWMLVWCGAGIAGGVADIVTRLGSRGGRPARRPRFGIPAWLVLTPLPYLVVASLSRFGYDRYAAALVPFWVIAGSLVFSRLSRALPAALDRRPAVLAGIGMAVLVVAAAVPLRAAPYGSQWASPLLGGQRTAVEWIPTEGGEASSRLDADLRALVGGDCARVRVADAYWHPAVDRCGRYFAPFDVADLRRADYAMSFQVAGQRPSREWYRPWLVDHAVLVSTVEVDGVVFGELWHLPGD